MSKPLLNKAIINCPDAGEVDLDIDNATKYFTNLCWLSRWNDEFRMIRETPTHRCHMKVTIKPEDAYELIDRLGLVRHQSMFASGSDYRLPEET